MPASGPGDPPAVVVKRARRVKRQAKQAQRVRQQAANAAPLSSKPAKPVSVKRVASARRATQKAMPLDEVAKRAPDVVPVEAPKPVKAKPLSAKPPAHPMGAGRPVVTKQQERAIAVAAYDQLPSGAAKRAHVKAAEKHIRAGHATEGDKAIVHAHKTRVEGSRKVARAVKDFEKLTPPKPKDEILTGGVGSLKFRNPGQAVASVGKIVRAVGAASSKGYASVGAPKALVNAPKDIAEIAVTTPTSVAHLAKTAVTRPEKVPGMLAEPYKELAKHPGKFFTEHPVTTALMVAPAARAPGLSVGKAARLAGKQTLKRDAAVLPGSVLKEARTGSRDAAVRAIQGRADRKLVKQGKKPLVTHRQVEVRVDEAFAAGQKHGERVSNRILRNAQVEAKKLPKAERKAHMELAHERARNASSTERSKKFAEEFGSTHTLKDGNVVEQPDVTTGVRHDTRADAQKVAEHLNAQNIQIPKGHGGLLDDPAGRKYRNEPADVKFRAIDAGYGKFAVVPDVATKRLVKHYRVGSSRATPAIGMRVTRRMMTKAVLPTRPTWLAGQGIEGAARSAIAQAGPTSLLRARRLEQRHPEMYKALAERAVPGGLGGRVAAEGIVKKTLNDEFHGESNIARRLTEWGQTPGIKQTRNLYDSYTRFVFDKVNGRVLEGIPQKAMLGRALKQSPLMERHVIGLSNKAIDEAARGLKNTDAQTQLAREVVKSYGKYAGFSPRLRSVVMHWTPFIPWYLNTAKFLLQTLPKDHPVYSALIADANAATEDWRKQQGLSLRYRNENSLPPWMLGGYPIQGGKNLLRIGHYVPAPSADPAGDVAGLVLPQFLGAFGAITYGKDWKKDDLKHPDGTPYNEGERVLYAFQQMLESMVPGYAQGTQLAQGKTNAKKLLRPVSVVKLNRNKDTGLNLSVDLGGGGGVNLGG